MASGILLQKLFRLGRLEYGDISVSISENFWFSRGDPAKFPQIPRLFGSCRNTENASSYFELRCCKVFRLAEVRGSFETEG